MRILVVKLSSLGDLFHCLPAIHEIKKAFNATVDWCVHSEYAGLLKCFTDIDNVIIFPRKRFFRDFSAFRRELTMKEYDLVLDFQGLFKSGLATFLAKGKRKIGPSFHREFSRMFYKEIAGTLNKNRHAVDEIYDFVGHLGIKGGPKLFPVEFPKCELKGTSRKIGILPVSRWITKNWPAECFINSAKLISSALPAEFYVIGSSHDIDVCRGIAAGIGDNAFNYAGKASLSEIGGLIKEMDLLIANDSGPVHMSAAIGVPTVVVFGPTNHNRTGPYGADHRVINIDLNCRPCYSRTCNRGDVACMIGITPDKVAEAAVQTLKRY